MLASLHEISGMLKAEGNRGGKSAIDRVAGITLEVLHQKTDRISQ
jgi:hypothetical protein